MGLLMGTTGKIEEGQILLDGKDIVHISNEERRKLRGSKISMIFQEPMTSLTRCDRGRSDRGDHYLS